MQAVLFLESKNNQFCNKKKNNQFHLVCGSVSETAKSQCHSILIFHCSLAIPTAISQTKEVLFIMDCLGRCYSFMMPDVDLLIVPSTLPDFAVSTMQMVEISMSHVCELFLPCTSIVNTYVIDVIYSVFQYLYR